MQFFYRNRLFLTYRSGRDLPPKLQTSFLPGPWTLLMAHTRYPLCLTPDKPGPSPDFLISGYDRPNPSLSLRPKTPGSSLVLLSSAKANLLTLLFNDLFTMHEGARAEVISIIHSSTTFLLLDRGYRQTGQKSATRGLLILMNNRR